jgi:hypothetical protein
MTMILLISFCLVVPYVVAREEIKYRLSFRLPRTHSAEWYRARAERWKPKEA